MKKYILSAGLLLFPLQTFAWIYPTGSELLIGVGFILIAYLAVFGFVILFTIAFFSWYRARKKGLSTKTYKRLFLISILWFLLNLTVLSVISYKDILSEDKYIEETIEQLLSEEFSVYLPSKYISEGKFSVDYRTYDDPSYLEIKLTELGGGYETITILQNHLSTERVTTCFMRTYYDSRPIDDICRESATFDDETLFCTLKESYLYEVRYCTKIDDVSISIRYPKYFHISIEEFVGSLERVNESLEYLKPEKSFERFMTVCRKKFRYFTGI